MAVWTAPRTWVDGEIPTATLFNQQISDNQEILKQTRNDLGQLNKLDSTTLDNLSGASLTGLGLEAAANAYTGRNRFNQGAGVRFVVPVGADKWTGTKGVDARGIWVEGTGLHHISSNFSSEWNYVGTYVSTPAGAVLGSLWVEGNDLHYIDASGDERRCIMSGTTGHSDAGALAASAWIETYTHWVREAGSTEKIGHADVNHADHNDHNDHTDHDDNGAHSDSTTHQDQTIVLHSDHTDHTDFDDLIASEPVHEDYSDHGDHTDYSDHTDHTDSGPHDDYSDHGDSTPHSDVALDKRPVAVA